MDQGLLSARNRREKVNDRQAPYYLELLHGGLAEKVAVIGGHTL